MSYTSKYAQSQLKGEDKPKVSKGGKTASNYIARGEQDRVMARDAHIKKMSKKRNPNNPYF